MRATTIKFLLLCLGIVGVNHTVAAGGWEDIIKPDLKRKADVENRQFSSRNFDAKKFSPKKFTAEKPYEPQSFPSKNFTTRSSTVVDRTFPEHSANANGKNFSAGNWQGAKEVPFHEAPQSQKVSQFQNKDAPRPDLPQLEKGLQEPPVMTEEEAVRLMEKLYNPFRKRGN